MAINRSTIMKHASDTNYRMGQDIFLVSHRIENFEIDISPYSNTPLIRAVVLDANGAQNDTEVTIDEGDDQILGSYCSCSDFETTDGLCRHCVALLLKYISRRHLDNIGHSLFTTRNEQVSQAMIESYARLGVHQPLEQQTLGTIVLEPQLSLEMGQLSLELRIGTQKKYVVKDILELARLVQQHEFYTYGKNLKFYHEREAFSDDSQPLLDFVLQQAAEYTYHFHCQQDNFFTYRTLKALRYLPLSPESADTFLHMVLGQTLTIQIDKRPVSVDIIEADPQLTLSLSHEKLQTYQLKLEGCTILPVDSHCWVLKDNHLYLCSDAFASDMRILLQENNRLNGHALYLTDKQMTPFCGSVLKAVHPHVELITVGIDLASFMPPDVTFCIYLDNPTMNTILCSAYAQYNDARFSLTDSIDYEQGYRDAAKEQLVLDAIRAYFVPADESHAADADFMIEHDDQAVFLFLEQGLPHFYDLAEVFISESMKRVRIVSAPKTTIGVSLSGNLLELDIQTKDLPHDELAGILNSYRRRRRFYRLKSGEFLRLEDNSLSVLSELADGLHLSGKDISEGQINIPLYRASYVDSVLNHHSGDVMTQRDRYFKSLIRDLKNVEDSDYEVPAPIKPILRDYQKTGYRWLRTITQLGFGGILADDMGLGKTLQIITLLAAVKEEALASATSTYAAQNGAETAEATTIAEASDIATPVSLIICPSSLVYNWASEIEHFAPALQTLIVTGSAAERQELLKDYQSYDVLVTSYDMLKRDIETYKTLAFRFEIIDEAQFIKNHTTQAARSVRMIQSVTRFALTGTPIENRLSELWSIFEYLMPGFLYPYAYFKNEIEQPVVDGDDKIAATRLKQMIKPFIMRRLKSDVLKELPDKLENAVYAQMTSEQQRLYDASVLALQKGLQAQTDESFKTNKIQVLAELTKLRQLCCDPSLLFSNYKGGAAKLDTCIQLIENAIAGGHKVLLFSQFTSMLDIIEQRLKQAKIAHYRLDGSTKSEQRVQMMHAFNEDATPVFMISLKAGGTGLNLTGADIVIHYDPWWNVAAQNQATDRAHRIGQTRTVTVYKLIARHTIEEKILKLQEAKQALADQIISGEGIQTAALTREDLLHILE